MATTAITSTSPTKEWVLACGANEQCQLEVLKNDISFVESELQPPIDPKETLSMYLLQNIPRDFQGDGTDSIWVFIDNKDVVRKRPYTPMRLHDADGNPIGSFKGAINIHDADVHNVPINEYFHKHEGASTTLASPITAGDTSITVTDGTGLTNGKNIQIENGVIETTFPTITDDAASPLLVLDRPIDNNFVAGDIVEEVRTNMNVLGTLAAPVAFRVIPDANQVWHIVTITISLTHTGASDSSLFGDLSALLNGLTLRAYNGTAQRYRTFTNWKNNAQIGLDFGEVDYIPKVGGGDNATFATASIKIIAGAVPEISGINGDFLEMLVQDDLQSLLTANAKIQGHREDI